jgi:hypothetical protein
MALPSLECRDCGFHLGKTEGLLGTHQVQLNGSIIDPLQCLRLADVQSLERLIDDFERRFLRVTCSVFVGDLPAGVGVSEAAVWLLNHALIQRRGTTLSASWAILVVINPKATQAGLAVGYALDACLPFGVIESLLHGVRHHLRHREFERAVRGVLGEIDGKLRAIGSARLRTVKSGLALTRDHLGLPKAGLLPPPRRLSAKPEA